jgi:predicted Zn-dependent peptidase
MRVEKDLPVARARELLFQAMFFGHPYAFAGHGREEVISKLTSQQIRDWHTQTVKRQLPIAIVVGDTQGSALVSSQMAEGFRRRDPEQSLKVGVPAPAKPGERSEPRSAALTTAAFGFAGPKATGSDLAAIEMIEAAMNGRGGRLLGELRDRQGLAIDSWLEAETLFAGGAVYAHLIALPENEQRARAALLAEMQRLSETGLAPAEMASSRAAAVTASLARLQNHRLRALAYARAVVYQRPATDVDATDERLSKVTAEDVKRAASAYFKPSLQFAGIVRGTSQSPK